MPGNYVTVVTFLAAGMCIVMLWLLHRKRRKKKGETPKEYKSLHEIISQRRDASDQNADDSDQ